MGIYIPEHKVQSLLKYKYSSTDLSLTSKYVLNPFWNKLVLLFPKTMAPNAITLLGLSMIFINFLTLLYYNPTLSCGSKPLHISLGGTWDPLFNPHGTMPSKLSNLFDWMRNRIGAVGDHDVCCPNWVYFSFAVGLFAYQSLDAIDGKQARRTGTSGPLGELFDHGCDAINTTLGAILTASALNLGLSWWSVASLVATNCNFYLSTWEEWHTGTLFLSAFSGPVEGILLVVGIFTVTGFKGPQFWDTGILTLLGISPSSIPFPIKNLPLNDLFLTFSSIGLVFNIITATHNVYLSLPSQSRTPLSLLKPLSRLSPWIIHTLAMLTWLLAKEPILLRTTLFLPFAFFWGISFAHHVQLLILAHLTKSKFPSVWKHPLLMLSILGSIDANLGKITKGRLMSFVQSSEERTKTVVVVCLGIAFIVYSHFVYEVIGDICAFYDINCLTIKRKSPQDSKKSPAELAKQLGAPTAESEEKKKSK